MEVRLAGHNLDRDLLDEIRAALERTSKLPASLSDDVDRAREDASRLISKDNWTPETLSAAYARISRDPRSIGELRAVAREAVDAARRSNESIIFGFGHASVAEHAVLNLDILGLSRLAVEEIERMRLCSYTEKSQRYILLDEDFVVPEEVTDAGTRGSVSRARAAAERLLSGGLRSAACRGSASRTRRSPPRRSTGARSKGWAKEDARYGLSLATTVQLGETLNARSCEALIARTAGHPLRGAAGVLAKALRGGRGRRSVGDQARRRLRGRGEDARGTAWGGGGGVASPCDVLAEATFAPRIPSKGSLPSKRSSSSMLPRMGDRRRRGDPPHARGREGRRDLSGAAVAMGSDGRLEILRHDPAESRAPRSGAARVRVRPLPVRARHLIGGLRAAQAPPNGDPDGPGLRSGARGDDPAVVRAELARGTLRASPGRDGGSVRPAARGRRGAGRVLHPAERPPAPRDLGAERPRALPCGPPSPRRPRPVGYSPSLHPRHRPRPRPFPGPSSRNSRHTCEWLQRPGIETVAAGAGAAARSRSGNSASSSGE